MKDEIRDYLNKNRKALPVFTTFWEINLHQPSSESIRVELESRFYNDKAFKIKPIYKPISKIINPQIFLNDK
jgi:hypothetical protein